MSDSNSSAVSIVGIIAIVILVVFAIYFFMLRPGDNGVLEIEINEPTSEMVPDQERSAPASLSFASFPG